jgi:hypothetical protein
MALFMNGSPPGLTDLKSYESSVIDVAGREGIDLVEKVRLARDEIGSEILAFLLRRLSTTEAAIPASRPDLGQVAATAPLRQWHLLRSLELIYRDAYNTQLNDRYLGKWREYERLGKRAGEMLFKTGIGLVSRPIPQAGAPAMTSVAAANGSAVYYARIAWTDASGAEGEPSEVAAHSSEPGLGGLSVTAPAAPNGVVGWNVYVGVEEGEETLQNGAPLAIGVSWVTSAGSLTAGRRPGRGQEPDRFVVDRQELRRG